MMGRIVWLVFTKELRETLRDRRTLIVMVLLPLALYPLIGIGMTQYIGVQQRKQQLRPSTIALRGAAWPELRSVLRGTRHLRLASPASSPPASTPAVLLKRKVVDAVVVLPARPQALDAGGTLGLHIFFDETRDTSLLALRRTRRALRAFGEEALAQRLGSQGLPASFTRPLKLSEESVASRKEVGSYLLARILPLIVVLMVLLGAFYPAIDVTAGEKERGTFESLLIAPVPRLSLILGKFLVVMTIAIMTGLLNLLSIGVTLGVGFGPALKAANVAAEIPWSALALTLVAIVPAAALFAAVMVGVASLARSFKEAQNLLTPVYLVCIVPAMAGQLPGFELDYGTALIPAVNVSLLTRELIAGHLALGPTLLALAATSVYALIALAIAARIYDSERLLFVGDRPIWRRRRRVDPASAAAQRGVVVAAAKRKAQALAGSEGGGGDGAGQGRDGGTAGPTAGVGGVTGSGSGLDSTAQLPSMDAVEPPQAIEAGLLMLVVMSLTVLVGVPLQGRSLIGGLLVTEWLLIAAPVVAALWLGKHDVRDVLSLRKPSVAVLIGALLAGASAWFLVSLFVEHVQQRFFPMPKELMEGMQKLLFDPKRPLAIDLFALAISPAICEELLFRGFLLRTSRATLGLRAAVLLNAVLFGLFHMSVYRFFPTAILGAVLSLIVLRSGSLWPAMLFHALNNSAAILLGRLLGARATQPESTPLWPYLPLALAACSLGLWLALRRGPHHDAPSADRPPASPS